MRKANILFSNDVCLKDIHALMGMVETKLTEEQIIEVINNMKEAFEFHTVDDAKEYTLNAITFEESQIEREEIKILFDLHSKASLKTKKN